MSPGTYEHQQIVAFLIALVIFLAVVRLISRRKITEWFARLSFSVSFFLLLASSFGFRYLFVIPRTAEISYTASGVSFIVNAGLAVLVIELFVWISKLNDRSRVLTQQVALLWDRLERAEGLEASRGSSA